MGGMHFLFETPEFFNELHFGLKADLESALEGAPAEAELFVVKAGGDLTKICTEKSAVFTVEEGSIKVSQNDQLFALLEAGDLIGLDFHCDTKELQLELDMAVKLRAYRRADLDEYFLKNPSNRMAWQSYLEKHMSLFFKVAMSFFKAGFQPETEVESFSAGEVIIEQGTPGKSVYHLLEGAADVIVDGVKVGDVKTDEIFGALAALTSSQRSATVRANEDSMVLKIPDDQFLNLVQNKPATVLALMKDMARAVTSLNEKLVDLSKLKG